MQYRGLARSSFDLSDIWGSCSGGEAILTDATETQHIPLQSPDDAQATQIKVRRFLAVADGTEESMVAIRYAALRAKNTGGRLTILNIIEPVEFQHWNTVAEAMRAEALEESEDLLVQVKLLVQSDCGMVPDTVIKEGKSTEVIVGLIEEDHGINLLVLGAAITSDGPGPLVNQLINQSVGALPIPITIVPGSMSDDTMRAVT